MEPVLMTLLKDEETSVRAAAVQSLGKLETASDKVIDCLVIALGHDDKHVREAAARSLGNIGQSSERAMEALKTALNDDEASVRKVAARLLTKLGWVTDEGVREMLSRIVGWEAIWSTPPGELARRVQALGQLEIKDESQLRRVLVPLNRHLHHMNDSVRNSALATIRQLLDGRPVQGYMWVPVRERWAQRKRVEAIRNYSLLLSAAVLFATVSLWQLGSVDPSSIGTCFLLALGAVAAFEAVLVHLRVKRLRNPWEESVAPEKPHNEGESNHA